MKSLDPKSLERIWLLATPLHEFTVNVAERQCQNSIPGWPTDWSAQDATRGSNLRFQQVQARLNTAQTLTIQDLVAGRIVGLGRRSQSNALEVVGESFWDGAVFDWTSETVKNREGRTVCDVRITNAVSSEPNAVLKRSREATKERHPNKLTGTESHSPMAWTRHRLCGRPNTSNGIRLVFRKLCNTRPHFEYLHLKRIIPAIRAELLGSDRQHEEACGYRFSSMAKIIGKERSMRRNRIQQSKRNKPE